VSFLNRYQVAYLAHVAGLPDAAIPMAVAISAAESGWRDDAIGTNPANPHCPNGSNDVGLWQINDCYHPQYSRTAMLNGFCNAQAMLSISSNGSNWNPWVTFTNGAYQRWLFAGNDALATAQARGWELAPDVIPATSNIANAPCQAPPLPPPPPPPPPPGGTQKDALGAGVTGYASQLLTLVRNGVSPWSAAGSIISQIINNAGNALGGGV